jgi:hypothetical protein
LSANALTVTPTTSPSLLVTLNGVDGFAGVAECAVTGAPNGILVNGVGFSLAAGGSFTVTFSAENIAVSGVSTVTFACSTNTLSAQAQLTLTVNAPPAISITLVPAIITIVPGGSVTVEAVVGNSGDYFGTVNGTVTGLPAGITGTQNFSTPTNSDVILDLSAASTATTSGTATVSITSGTLSATASLPITVNTTPDFTLNSGIFTGLSIYQNDTTTFTASSTSVNGFSQPIAVSFPGLPSGISLSPSTFSLQPGASQVVTVTSNFTPAAGSQPTITMTGVAGSITHQSQFQLYIMGSTPGLNIVVPSTVAAGSIVPMQIEVHGVPGGLGTISVQLSSVSFPIKGVTFSPSSFTTPGGGGQAVIYIEAAADAVGGYENVTATYGPLSEVVQQQINIGPAQSAPAQEPLSTHDQLVRTNSLTQFSLFPPPNYLIYHSATNRFFSTDYGQSRLNVTDAASNKLAATLNIPKAFGLDQAPDGSVLYVGTLLGDLYVVDPVNLTILKRYPTASISAYGFAANAVYALADGNLILDQYYIGPDGGNQDQLALWNPSTNAITLFVPPNTPTGNGNEPQMSTCLPAFQSPMLIANRSRVLLAEQPSNGSIALCSFDPETGASISSQTISGGGGDFSNLSIALSSDGSTLVVFDGSQADVVDASTLVAKSSFALPAYSPGFQQISPVIFFSQDNTKLFVTDPNGGDILDVYDLASGTMTGWIPQTNLNNVQTEIPVAYPLYQAMSSNGFEAGVIDGGGIGLLDISAIQELPIGTRSTPNILQVPYGSVEGGTATVWVFGGESSTLGSAYFGSNPATDESSIGIGVSAFTPAGKPGPVDLRTFATDGGSQFLPAAFSYGPWVEEAATSYSTADGGGPGSIFGFGFGPQYAIDGNFNLTIPPDLQVSVGEASGAIESFNAQPLETYSDFPQFPFNAFVYTVPAGDAGTTANIQISNNSGSTTAGTQITYLPKLQQYTVAGQLADGVYDSKRDVYYFTDATQIRVFSLTKGAWQPSIPIPAPSNGAGPERLFGVSLSPDASRLAVSDPGSDAIYLLDPDQPSSVQSYALALQQTDPPTGLPTAVAVADDGSVFFTSTSGGLDVLNPTTGIIGPLRNSVVAHTLDARQQVAIDNNDLPQIPTANRRLVLSADGSRLYYNVGGFPFCYEVSTNQTVNPPSIDQSLESNNDELVLGASQNQLFAAGFFSDNNLNNNAMQILDFAESLDADYVYGAALSADGSLLFQPGTQSIDVFDGNTGVFRARIALPVQLSPNFRALVSDNKDSRLVAITGATGNGIAVIDLTSLPEPSPPTYVTAAIPASSSRNRPSGRPAASRNLTRERDARGVAQDIHRRSSPLLAKLTRGR